MSYNRLITISKSEEEKLPQLILRSITGDAFNNEILTIKARGLIGSLRKAKDGITFFGCKDLDNTVSSNIDYELNISNSNLSQMSSSILFFI